MLYSFWHAAVSKDRFEIYMCCVALLLWACMFDTAFSLLVLAFRHWA